MAGLLLLRSTREFNSSRVGSLQVLPERFSVLQVEFAVLKLEVVSVPRQDIPLLPFAHFCHTSPVVESDIVPFRESVRLIAVPTEFWLSPSSLAV
jgi:hypothetical protein